MSQLNLFNWSEGKYRLEDLDKSCPHCISFNKWLRIESDYGDGPTYQCQSVDEFGDVCNYTLVDDEYYSQESVEDRIADTWKDE